MPPPALKDPHRPLLRPSESLKGLPARPLLFADNDWLPQPVSCRSSHPGLLQSLFAIGQRARLSAVGEL